jgi:UDP-N-acetylglucosamine 4,6-dehydratase/5-epimerase
LYAFKNGNQGDLFVQKAPASSIDVLAKAILELKKVNIPPVYIGTRHGEKLYEVLVTQEEMAKAVDSGDFYKIPADNRNLNYDQYIERGNPKITKADSYHSHNTKQLDIEGMKKLLLKLNLFE